MDPKSISPYKSRIAAQIRNHIYVLYGRQFATDGQSAVRYFNIGGYNQIVY